MPLLGLDQSLADPQQNAVELALLHILQNHHLAALGLDHPAPTGIHAS